MERFLLALVVVVVVALLFALHQAYALDAHLRDLQTQREALYLSETLGVEVRP